MLQEESSEKSKIAESEELNFDKPNFKFVPKGNHEWRQQGYFIVCKSCEIEHATFIGPKKLLIGFNSKNEPIFKDRFKVEGRQNLP